MLFNSLEYLLFLPVVLALYWGLARRSQNTLLLVASYVFYAAWDPRFLLLLGVSTVVDFRVGNALERTDAPQRRKALLITSLVVNLGILGFFKYFNFFVDSFAELMNGFGLATSEPMLRIILPVGISFYTFQTLSYTIDVYRKKLPAEKSLLNFAVYVAYFPQLVAGPIERAGRLLPQIRETRTIDYPRIRSGLFLILLGLVRKVAIADALAPTVDRMFGGAAEESWVNLLIGVIAFALQIYGDFAGYTDIARGTSRLLGIELMRNFEQPYLARNITQFWQTWHISLSTWLRDYLYIPLGGSRGTRWQTFSNLMITMLLGGLWHGAGWTFVVWGGLHGLYLSLHRAIRRKTARAATAPFRWRDVAPAVGTFAIVGFAWIFFRAVTFTQAFEYIQGLFTLRGGAVDTAALELIIFVGAVSLTIDLLQRNLASHTSIQGLPALARGVSYATMLVLIVVFAGGESIPFIYFQF